MNVRMLMRGAVLPIALIVLTSGGGRPAGAAPTKKIIEMGWDEPDTKFLRDHVAEMKQSPFDGCVFHLEYRGANGTDSSFTRALWSTRAFSRDEVAPAIANLQATDFGAFRHNFLRINASPGDLDWFANDDALMANARLAAEVAKIGGCDGVMFDPEQYTHQIWWFDKQPQAKTKGWDAYAAAARARGQRFMTALQQGDSNLVVFLTFGYSHVWNQTFQGKYPVSGATYALLVPFLDGMYSAAQGNARIVDGHEPSYAYLDPKQFVSARTRMKTGLVPMVGAPEAYAKHLSVGFGVWLDNESSSKGWDAANPAKNYFNPKGLQQALAGAVDAADEYVWVYSQTPRWWSDERTTKHLPKAYVDAVRTAQQRAHGQAVRVDPSAGSP